MFNEKAESKYQCKTTESKQRQKEQKVTSYLAMIS